MTDTEQRPALVVDFDGEVGTFAAQDRANQAVLVKYVDDLFTGGYAAVKAAVELSRDMVLPEDIERFDEFLLQHGRAENFTQSLYDALDACWKGETHLPFESSPASSDTSSPTSGDPSSREDLSSPATAVEPIQWDVVEPPSPSTKGTRKEFKGYDDKTGHPIYAEA